MAPPTHLFPAASAGKEVYRSTESPKTVVLEDSKAGQTARPTKKKRKLEPKNAAPRARSSSRQRKSPAYFISEKASRTAAAASRSTRTDTTTEDEESRRKASRERRKRKPTAFYGFAVKSSLTDGDDVMEEDRPTSRQPRSSRKAALGSVGAVHSDGQRQNDESQDTSKPSLLDEGMGSSWNCARLSSDILILQYDVLASQGACEEMNFGNSLERTKQRIRAKLDELKDKLPDELADKEIQEDIRDYKRSLKSLSVLRENERLMRAQEKEQDKEQSLRDAYYKGRQRRVTAEEREIAELGKRRIWQVGDKEFRLAGSRKCCIGKTCNICQKQSKRMKDAQPEELLLPRCRKVGPRDLDETRDKKNSETKRGRRSRRSLRTQNVLEDTRMALGELQTSLGFVDKYNATVTF